MGQNLTIRDHFKSIMHLIMAIVLLMVLSLIAIPARADTHISKTSVGDLVGTAPSTLDWKTNEIVIPFDLPQTVWVDKVEVLISARPTGALRHRRNLQVRINGSDPIILKAQGQRFDARIKLAQKHLRSRGNKLYISGISTSSTCAGPNHAGWEISKERSMLVFYGRNMTRDLTLRDLVSLWDQPTTTPSNLGIKVLGADKFRHESLITQAITLRTGRVPRLRTAFSGNHLDIIAGLRSDVTPYIRASKTNEAQDNDAQGAAIILDQNRPPRLILTGDTEEEVRQSVNAFATHKLPLTRRPQTSPYELTLQPALSTKRTIFEGHHKLSDAGAITALNQWTTPPLTFNFDTPFAAQRSGEVVLKLNSDEVISSTSTLEIMLNGKALGETQIDAPRKTVKFDIPEGYLTGTGNNIEIITHLRPSDEIEICDVVQTRPSFSLGQGSKVLIEGKVDKNVNDVSNIVASTSPFALSENVIIFGTSTRTSDRQATLRLIGQMAKVSGHAWTHATYIDGANPLIPPTDNILVLGPKTRAMNSFIANAPKALRLALNGGKLPDIREEQRISSLLRIASLDADQAFQLAANSANRNVQRYASGLMALYDDPENRQTVGIITTRPGASFSNAANHLLTPEIWKNLSGSVAQWDSKMAVMVQSAQPKTLGPSLPLNPDSLDLGSWLTAFNWETFDNINHSLRDALHDIWEAPLAYAKNSFSKLWTNIADKWAALFDKPSNTPRELSHVEPNPTVKLKGKDSASSSATLGTQTPKPVLSKPSAVASRTIQTPKTLKLRGSYDPETFTEENPHIKGLSHTLDNGWSSLSKTLAKVSHNVKLQGQTAYKKFDRWGQSVNKTRESKGQTALVPSPLLALLLVTFGGLILMSIAKPRQLRY